MGTERKWPAEMGELAVRVETAAVVASPGVGS